MSLQLANFKQLLAGAVAGMEVAMHGPEGSTLAVTRLNDDLEQS
jgi:hypothetical protein